MRSSLALLAVAATLATGAAHAADYAVDPTHTFVTFEIGHFNTSTNRGRFDKKEGTIQFDRAARTGKVDITIDVASVSTGTAAFDKHLNSADLFNTAVHPKARFVSDKLVFNGDKVVEVPGQFTFMGKTAPLTLKAVRFNCYDNPMLKREVCGGDFEAVVDRTVYGMDYAIAFGVPKDVRLVIQVEAVRQ
ncbi:YceI family protein [uncultured Hydrogenophaga sp.]|uniref:YceI family protein n=1 Tax=uncultured Hydrogenophaga sp. TaxID=199683 RepID=UPI00265E9E91|nr:YceI family protein [uncultured Hydrogenophaga sp.]